MLACKTMLYKHLHVHWANTPIFISTGLKEHKTKALCCSLKYKGLWKRMLFCALEWICKYTRCGINMWSVLRKIPMGENVLSYQHSSGKTEVSSSLTLCTVQYSCTSHGNWNSFYYNLLIQANIPSLLIYIRCMILRLSHLYNFLNGLAISVRDYIIICQFLFRSNNQVIDPSSP